MWLIYSLAALYLVHRVSRPMVATRSLTNTIAIRPMPPTMIADETADQSKAWEETGSTVELNPFWAGEGGPADPFLLKMPAVSTASSGGAILPGGGGAGGGGGGAGGGRGMLK